jgi:hypothetical protein
MCSSNPSIGVGILTRFLSASNNRADMVKKVNKIARA